MKPNVAIIGAGPAGLLAAFGASTKGCKVNIYAADVPKKFPGAQILQQSIPGLTPEFADAYIHVAKWGEEELYRAKVYGPESTQRTSWQDYGGPVRAWDMSATYVELLDRFTHAIVLRHVMPEELAEIAEDHDATINTAPVPMFCTKPFEHDLSGATVRITEGAQLGVQHNQIVYNGTSSTWYRSSRLFGRGSTEWPGNTPSVGGVVVRKPISTNCDCWQDLPSYFRAGRYGRWEKGLLVHDGYETGVMVADALLEL